MMNLKMILVILKKNMIYIDTIYNPAQTKMIKYFKSKKLNHLMD